MAGEKSRPPKPLQKIPVGSQAHRALNCLPKADELFIATELACESTQTVSFSQFQNRAVSKSPSFKTGATERALRPIAATATDRQGFCLWLSLGRNLCNRTHTRL